MNERLNIELHTNQYAITRGMYNETPCRQMLLIYVSSEVNFDDDDVDDDERKRIESSSIPNVPMNLDLRRQTTETFVVTSFILISP